MHVAQFTTPTFRYSACTYTHVYIWPAMFSLPHLHLSSSCNMPSFEVEAVVHGYYVYKEIWNPLISEELLFCTRDLTNLHDLFTIAVI